jgi:hypothetical protein
VIAAGEPGHVGDVADHSAGVDRAEAEDLGQTGAGGSDGRGQLLLGVAELGVQASQVFQELTGQLAARRRDRASSRLPIVRRQLEPAKVLRVAGSMAWRPPLPEPGRESPTRRPERAT